tara:strand:- start:368 stop:550 length:183 start_codon:yes stop_codon:yes gene_type:complete
MKRSSRELALEWWRQLSFDKQKQLLANELMSNKFRNRRVLSLTGREVEIIWKSEKQQKND